MTDKELKTAIQKAIMDFSIIPAHQAAIGLFKTLGYNTERQNPLPNKSYDDFKDSFLGTDSTFNEEKACVKEWKSIDLLFQLTADEVSSPSSHFDIKQVDNTIIETYLFFSIELTKAEYNRTQLAQITREINKVFPMPVLLVFKHGESITLSVINRRLNKKDDQKDVLEKVTVIKDISTTSPHRAHIEILFDLSFSELQRVHKFSNFVQLHNAWQKTLDTKELNKRFYRDLSNWYFWALQEVHFPKTNWVADNNSRLKEDERANEHNAKNLIRLLTRLLFVWFVKEKNLVPDELFDESYIKDNLLNGFEPRKKKDFDHKTQGSKYYRAILQNLFFATLNQTVGKRAFRKDGQQMNVTNLMRYESYFKDPEKFIELVDVVVPFMNGGLFECLDSPDPLLKGKQGGDVIIYEDGFSDRKDNTLCVPDYIFFGTAEHADLSEELGDKKQKDVTVNGLINILKSYKFTVTENTPIEEDIALDPELLGRVFENLLASYNPETKTTARKQTGSFYTPREIVNYMVDESLKAYLNSALTIPGQGLSDKVNDNGQGLSDKVNDNGQGLSDKVNDNGQGLSDKVNDNGQGLSDKVNDDGQGLSDKVNDDGQGLSDNVNDDGQGLPSNDDFETFFDPNGEIQMHTGNLPHWQQDNVCYFVTFRLADSIPAEVVEQIKTEREYWLKKNSKNADGKFSKEQLKEYYRLFSSRIEDLLNNGKGSCVLKDPKIALIVANALEYFNNNRYLLDEWVIMPNHVHILVKPLGENKLPDILHSWKSFTANEINKALGKKGSFWMHESYDHIVRNEQALHTIRNYIRQNPVKANLKEGEYLLNRSKDALDDSNRSKDAMYDLNRSKDALDDSNRSKDALDDSNRSKDAMYDLNRSKDAMDDSNRSKDAMYDLNRSKDAMDDLNRSKDAMYDLNRSKDAMDDLSRSKDASDTLEERLSDLISYSENQNPFNEEETKVLINAIDNCKILDPACGSGAFPMGILHKLVHILHKLDPSNRLWKERQIEKAQAIEDSEIRNKLIEDIETAFENNELDYGRKLYLIENCIYGVDIQPIATQISKLRFFISLIVDQKCTVGILANGVHNNFGIRPLPNLETKFVAANTLIGIEKPKEQLTIFDNHEVQELEDKLKDVRHRLFSAKTPATKRKLREEDQRLREEMGNILEDAGWSNESARQLAAWDPYNQNVSSGWFDPEWMFGIVAGTSSSGNSGFDIVIGNPPYVQLQKDGGKLANTYKNCGYATFERTGDIYALFYEMGIKALRIGGHLCFITSNKWMRAGYGKSLRKFFISYNPVLLIDCGPGVFENATVDVNILLIQHEKNKKQLSAVTLDSKAKDNDLGKFVKEKSVLLSNLNEDSWFIGSSAEQKLKEKIERIGKPLKDWDVRINYGIKTGLNDAFIIDTATKEKLCQEDPKSAEILKPILRGRDIKRYSYEWAGLWIIATGYDLDVPKLYPAIYKHLLQYEDKAKKRDDQGANWWNLRACAYYSEFEKEKVVWGNISYDSSFVLLDKSFFLNAPGNIITSNNFSLKYLLGCFNSKIFSYEFKKIGIFLGHAFEWKKQYVEQVHIPLITPKNKPISERIENLVDEILTVKKENIDADTSEQEREIDLLVYDLYELTEEEIAIIEGSVK